MKITACHEDWNKMIPNSTGRHCTTCNLTVINLTGKSQNEIEEMKETKGKICGRIPRAQLSEFQYLHPLKRFAIALFLVFGTGLFTTSYAQILQEKQIEQTASEKFVIKFHAMKTNQESLGNVYINFDVGSKFSEGKTNENGELTLTFTADKKEVEIYVNISYMDFYGSLKFVAKADQVNHFDRIIYDPENNKLTVGNEEFYEVFIMGDIAPIDWEETPEIDN